MAALSRFIKEHTEEILTEWETFARSLPIGASMDVGALRDHAKAMLNVIARDLEAPQTSRRAGCESQRRVRRQRADSPHGSDGTRIGPRTEWLHGQPDGGGVSRVAR